MKRLLLLMCLSVGIAHANPTEKQKIIEMVKSQDDGFDKFYSSDGKRFYQKEMTINDKGGLDVRVREKYLPAVTDGKTYTPKSSYFAFSPKVMRYAGKVAKGANAVGMALLVADILGEGVDWVLDPKNNTITINNSLYRNFEIDKRFSYNVYDINTAKATADKFLNGELSMGVSIDCYKSRYSLDIECAYGDGRFLQFYHMGKSTKVMSETEFEQAVKDLAKSGNINAKQVILDAGKEEIADGKHDDDITRLADDITSGNAQDDPQPDPDNPPADGTDTPTDGDTTSDPKTPPDDTGQGDKKDDNEQADEVRQDRTPNNNFELPPFCSWAGVVCDFIDWVKKDDTDKEDTEFELEQDLTPDIDTDIKFNGQCPADVVISGTIFGQVISFTFFEWSKFCTFLAMLKPIIIALASYQAVRIVGGVNVAD